MGLVHKTNYYYQFKGLHKREQKHIRINGENHPQVTYTDILIQYTVKLVNTIKGVPPFPAMIVIMINKVAIVVAAGCTFIRTLSGNSLNSTVSSNSEEVC